MTKTNTHGRSSRRVASFTAIAAFGLVPLLAACPKKDPPVVDSGAAPSATVVDVPDTGEFLPLDLDSGTDSGDSGDSGKKATGPFVSPNVARIRQCCGQIQQQAKSLGASPEAGMLLALAGQCNVAANALQTNPNAPEVAMFKQAMAGRNLPPVCQGF
jgi:hypothetical protein